MIVHSDFSGHTMFVQEVTADQLPASSSQKDGYATFYEVRNQDKNGVVFMYLGRGLRGAPKEIVAWYPKGDFWSSYGTTFKSAIEGAQKDGWLSA